jgi:hypothetical protein
MSGNKSPQELDEEINQLIDQLINEHDRAKWEKRIKELVDKVFKKVR